MVVLIRSNDIVTDPRAMKYVKYLKETGQDYILIGWDRDGIMQDSSTAYYYHKMAGYNVGGIKAVLNRIGWMKFVVGKLLSLKLQNFIIHACDLDSAYPSVVYNKLVSRRKKARILFDVFDWFSATLHSQPRPILWAFKHMEYFSVKNSQLIVICEPERIEQIPYSISNDKISVLPNIPFFSDSSFLVKKGVSDFDNNLLTLSYVGGFSKDRCLFELVQIAESGVINLAIAGYGNKELEELLSNLEDCPNIKYYGKVAYQDGLNISYNSDVMYAMYSTVNPNNVYAAPNKYYEAMFLGKPLLSTKGTIVEKKILNNNIGYVSGESIDEIKTVISSINRDSINTLGGNAARLWKEKYCLYTSKWLQTVYQSFINKE